MASNQDLKHITSDSWECTKNLCITFDAVALYQTPRSLLITEAAQGDRLGHNCGVAPILVDT